MLRRVGYPFSSLRVASDLQASVLLKSYMCITARSVAPILVLACTDPALAHAFPDHSSPQARATVDTASTHIKVWFNGRIEPEFSTLIVKNAAGAQVSAGTEGVDTANYTLLETSLPKALPAGKYVVYWRVVAHGGHRSDGQFAFTVK